MRENYQKREASEYNFFRARFQWLTCAVFALYYKIAFNLTVEGRENVPKKGFCIVASNHTSANDPFIVIHSIKRPTAYMAKIELFKNPVARFFLDWLGAFAVDRSKVSVSTVKTCHGIKNTGWCLGIFPQGKREKEGEVNNINKGFANFARSLKCDILPVAITGVEKDKRKFFRGKMKVKIGKPIPYNENVDKMINIWTQKIEQMTEENTKPNYAQRSAKDFNIWTRLYQFYTLFILFLPIFGLFFYNFKIKRNKNLDKNKQYIVAPNHISYLDVFILNHAVSRPLAYMAKQELFKDGTWGQQWVTRNIRRLGAFAVNREKPTLSTIKTAREVFKAKFNLCIFPQGGIRKNKLIENINPGFIYFAKTNKIDILPVSIAGLEEYNWIPFKKKDVNIVVGEPISYTLDEKEIVRQWGEQISKYTGYENRMNQEETVSQG